MQTPCGDLVARQGAIPEAEEHQGIRRLALCSLRLDHEERMKFWTSSVLQAHAGGKPGEVESPIPSQNQSLEKVLKCFQHLVCQAVPPRFAFESQIMPFAIYGQQFRLCGNQLQR